MDLHPAGLRPNYGARYASSPHAYSSASAPFSSSYATSSASATSTPRAFTSALEVSARARFPLDPSDGDFMCRGEQTRTGWSQPCDMYAALPGSGGYRGATDGLGYLSKPGYQFSVSLLALPALLVCVAALAASVYCCWTRRRHHPEAYGRLNHAKYCLTALSNWPLKKDLDNCKDDVKHKPGTYPRAGITGSTYFRCAAPFCFIVAGLSFGSWASTAAYSGIAETAEGICSFDAAVRSYTDILEETRDAYAFVDPNSPPVPAGNGTNGPNPPEVLNELAIALRKGIDSMGGLCPGHGSEVSVSADGGSSDSAAAAAGGSDAGNKLKHEPLMKFFVGLFAASVLLPVVISVPGFLCADRPSLRMGMRTGCLALSLTGLLMATTLAVGLVQSETCPGITGRLEHDLLLHANGDAVVKHQLELMVRCNTGTMNANETALWNHGADSGSGDGSNGGDEDSAAAGLAEGQRVSLWVSEEARIMRMVERTKQEQASRSGNSGADEAPEERRKNSDDVNTRLKQQLALAKWLGKTASCEEFGKSYTVFLESTCGEAFGWFEQCAIACMFLSLTLCLGTCCMSSADWLIEESQRMQKEHDRGAPNRSGLLSGKQSRRYWPSL
jgi:hypothetical protein